MKYNIHHNNQTAINHKILHKRVEKQNRQATTSGATQMGEANMNKLGAQPFNQSILSNRGAKSPIRHFVIE